MNQSEVRNTALFHTWSTISITLFVVLAVITQGVIEPSTENIICAVLSGMAALCTFLYCLSPGVIGRSPLSTLAVVGLNVSTTGGALAAQTLSGRPLTYNLDLPLKTFAVCAFLSMLAIMVHAAYNNFSVMNAARARLSQSLLKPLGAFKTPGSLELWLLGFVGLAAVWSSGIPASGNIAYGDVSGKFQQALMPFTIAPFVILVKQYLTDDRRRPAGRDYILIAFYFLFVVIISMARNSRGSFATSLLSMGLATFLAIALGRLQLTRRSITTFAILLPFCLVFLSSLSNLATAMVIARASRDTATAGALIRETISIAQDPLQVERRRQMDAILTSGYNEAYISNPLLARLVHIKFVDLNLRHADGITEAQKEKLYEEMGRRIVNFAPTPVLQKMGIHADKSSAQYSSGDFYRNIAARGTLGSFTSGSSIADGLTMFGAASWAFSGIMFFFFFFFLDALTVRNANGDLTFSIIALFNLPTIFSGTIVSESVSGLVGTVVRTMPQTLLLTCGALALARVAAGVLANARR